MLGTRDTIPDDSRVVINYADTSMDPHPDDCECLQAVERTSEQKRDAGVAQVQAIWAARDHGASYRKIGMAAGMSGEGVRGLVAVRDEALVEAAGGVEGTEEGETSPPPPPADPETAEGAGDDPGNVAVEGDSPVRTDDEAAVAGVAPAGGRDLGLPPT